MRITGPFTVEQDNNNLWITDSDGFAVARLELRPTSMPEPFIAEFTEDEVRAQAQYIVDAMNERFYREREAT